MSVYALQAWAAQRAQQDHERYFDCTLCGERILVCCHVRDINPARYVGVACGCRLKPKVTG